MNQPTIRGGTGPLIVLLHWLGGDATSWQAVSEDLAMAGLRPIALDLPGFGENHEDDDLSIDASLAALIATVRNLRQDEAERPWLLAGHSMGGKFAVLIARAAAEGTPGLENLRGLVLVSPSPVGPEPMPEHKRAQLLETLGTASSDTQKDRHHAVKFLDDNTGKLPLDPLFHERAVATLLRRNPTAFAAWLTSGSLQDCSERAGVLDLPALILAGSEESELGPAAQRKLTLPHLPSATLVALEGGGHLAPLERPAEVASRIVAFAQQLGLLDSASEASPSPEFAALMESAKTSPQTRAVMQQRLASAAPAPADLFAPEELLTLRALIGCVVPAQAFDLTARIVAWLGAGSRDGWRFDALPSDVAAWKCGLASLDDAAGRAHHVPFVALGRALQTALLRQARKGEVGKGLLGSLGLGAGAERFHAAQMQQWFEDVRAAAAQLYVADPRTMDRVGFRGFADEDGFTHIRLEDNKGANA